MAVMPQDDAILIQALQDPMLFDHKVSKFEVIVTHSSRVLLTGDFAYKFKRPVDFGFLDYSTLQKQRHAIYREFEVNLRYAPQIYLEVKAVYGSAASPSFVPNGAPIAYALKMRQFKQEEVLSVMAKQHLLSNEIMDDIANKMADLHAEAALAGEDDVYGTIDCIKRWTAENFEGIAPFIQDENTRAELQTIHSWVDQFLVDKRASFSRRKQNGKVRECHGDCHLANMVMQDTGVMFFDAIEFNEELRWIDVQSELAFILIDLQERGFPQLANRLLNRYLSQSGDYDGLEVLPLYLVYRALVRAKVALLRFPDSEEGHNHLRLFLKRCLDIIEPHKQFVTITCGYSGSGKSVFARWFGSEFGAIHLQSDVERKRLHGLSAGSNSRSQAGRGLYTAEDNRRTYQRLGELAEQVLQAGWSVVVDATFLDLQHRQVFRELAAKNQTRFAIFYLDVPEEELRNRIRLRLQQNLNRSDAERDASEADEAILTYQLGMGDLNISSEKEVCVVDQAWRQNDAHWKLEIQRFLLLNERSD